jgi:hypothetical protein
MTNIADAIGRVMMTAVRLPRPSNNQEAGFRKFAETEFGKDSAYAYDCLINNRPIDLR